MTYDRRNFPGHHDLCVLPEMVKMNGYGYLCICMGALGPMVTGGRKNKTKRSQNGRV